MNYIDTFILAAEDCPASRGIAPAGRSEKKSVAEIQYKMLAGHPYEYTQEDVLFQTFVQHKEIPAKELKARGREFREQFFAKPQPCLRTSPLARRYGWGFHFDHEGKVALYPAESAEYEKLAKRASNVLKALASSRR